MKSIRKQIIIRVLAGTFLMLALASALFSVVIRMQVVKEFDRVLKARAQGLIALTSREERLIEIDINEDAFPQYASTEEDDEEEEEEEESEKEEFEEEEEEEEEGTAFYMFFMEDGSVVKKSASLGTASLPFHSELSNEPHFLNLELPNEEDGRLVQIVFTPQVDEPDDEEKDPAADEDVAMVLAEHTDPDTFRLVLVVADSRERLDSLLEVIYLALVLLTALLLAGIGLVVFSAVKLGFKPVDALNAQIEDIGPEKLGTRIRIPSPPTELAAVQLALNDLLERLENGLLRERRFSSNVAHELRTPVAELRTACEVGGKWPDDPAETQRLFEDIREIALHMEKIASSLLTLSRCENGSATVHFQPVKIAEVIEACCRRKEAKATEKQVRFGNDVDEDLVISTDHDHLRMIIQNLIDNAVTYCTPGTMITCTGTQTTGGINIVVSNQVNDIATSDIHHVFERFWQKDPFQSSSGHVGLGLSIAQAMADVLGMEIKVALRGESTFEARISMPA